ncbi:unnamed protein product [Parascedosporium putredinis]|uniref:Methyltransferase type 11 domain-containing protein n=1 Tax=Parascedosporium putredinis TaxID=1442378 RepID=A0A9P1H5Q2_9PEZI|nr:unnamed protein product [Parascedosporium putredinis]CAI7999546.1 unnamed protein product [Parascedosporium putredinis]
MGVTSPPRPQASPASEPGSGAEPVISATKPTQSPAAVVGDHVPVASIAPTASTPATTVAEQVPASIGEQPLALPEEDPDHYEQTHVHSVYESIAPHFSQTRHKPWPFVTSFLLSLPAGSVGLDVGCGNGKYVGVNPNLTILASDRSASLCRLARENTNPSPPRGEPGHQPLHGADVCVADSLSLPFRSSSADFVISIAVVHHFSTPARRRSAIVDLLDCVRPGGKLLVYVWALEQRSSRRGWDEGGEQDLLVPWVMRGKKGSGGAADETFQRYYHLYRQGELEEDVVAAGGRC